MFPLKYATGTADKSDMNINPSQFDTLHQMLNYTSAKHKAVSENIANVNTPGYQRRDVTFEASLQQKLQGGDFQADGEPVICLDTEAMPPRADGNNVDIDQEMSQLAKNSLLHQTATQLLASRLATMRSAITGR